MVREKLIFKVEQVIPDDIPTILGANYYRDWDADLGVSTTTGLVNTWTDQANGVNLVGTGATRPQETTTARFSGNVIEFDGVSEYLADSASSADYNFIHDGSGGAVIVVGEMLSTPVSIGIIIGNSFAASDVGFRFQYNNANQLAQAVVNGSTVIVSNTSTNTINNNEGFYNIDIIDADNGTAADRAELILDGTSTKANVNTGTPSVANATSSLVVGKRATASSFYLNANIKRIIIADSLLTADQITQIKSRLAYEYGTFPIT